MPTIRISYVAPGADVVAAKLDDQTVSFSGTAKAGQAEGTVNAGQHRLRYTIQGLPGTGFTWKIEGPSLNKTVTDTIGETGIAAGTIPFTVSGAVALAESAAGRKGSKKKAAAKRKAAKRPAAKTAPKKRASKKGAAKKGSRR